MAFPADTRLMASDDYGKGAHGWNCGQFSAQAQRDGTVNYIPDCTSEPGGPGRTLTAHINFQTCWDGVLPNHQPGDVGDTSDNAHYRYPSGKGVCRAGFPNTMVQLRPTIQFDSSAMARTSSCPATRTPASTTARRCPRTSGTPGFRRSSWTTSGSA